MSVRVMAMLWDLPMEPTQKLVLLALADAANDEGLCWPSIATVARKSGVSERSVQRSIRQAQKDGILMRQEVVGKGCKYTFNPRHSVTGDTVSPATNATQTPDTVSPKPSRTINDEIAKAIPSTRVKVPVVDLPEWIPQGPWQGWIDMRTRKHAKPGNHAINLAIAKLEKLRRDGHDPGEVLDASTLNNWTGLFPLKDSDNERRQRIDTMGGTGAGHGIGRTGRAALVARERIRAAGYG